MLDWQRTALREAIDENASHIAELLEGKGSGQTGELKHRRRLERQGMASHSKIGCSKNSSRFQTNWVLMRQSRRQSGNFGDGTSP